MLLLDITVVNVALPDIQKELDTDLTGLQWVVDAYTLLLAAFTLTMGTLADRFGRRRLFVIGGRVCAFASLLCGLATSATCLHLARGLQGVGGAAMFATSLALIAQEFQGPERGTAIAAWGATIGGAGAVRARAGCVASGARWGSGRWSAGRSPTGSAGSGSSSSTSRSGSAPRSSPRP